MNEMSRLVPRKPLVRNPIWVCHMGGTFAAFPGTSAGRWVETEQPQLQPWPEYGLRVPQEASMVQ